MKTIFLIDDDPDDREIFQEILGQEHPSIVFQQAENGSDAFAKLKSVDFVKPDVIFLDLNMPIMDGRAFLQQIKKEAALQDIPVIIYSTSSSDIDKKFAAENKASQFLTKQYSIELLRKDLNAVVEKFLKA
ncbi:response regulator [Flavobacterium sp. HBTb2-11-1]|uniref:response regulator n=1 Tax=Flavobacterium sp. HBTb2-11-1 TaxID=2692212 RepID=UPI001371D16D|nr:response regulator [Flavobacterium sp. HBTb2-11-1]MXO04403.1 response regulator [Flavobacterium sp. HBTb2-11-1]